MFSAFQCFLIMAGLIALLCGWEWRKPICRDIEGPDADGEVHCPAPAPPPPAVTEVHKYNGHANYNDEQKAAYAICDVAFTHYVRSGQKTLDALHDQCKAVLPKVKEMGAPDYKDYVKLCVTQGTKVLAEQKHDDSDKFHDGCVDHIVSIAKNVTLLSLRTGAKGFAESGNFTRLTRLNIAPDAVEHALAEAEKDTAALQMK